MDRTALRRVRWHPPTDGYIKVNVDDSSFGNPSNVGFAGLLRNSNETWIYGFSGTTSNMFVELSSIWQCLQLAWDLGYMFIILKSDSKAAMDLIEDVHKLLFSSSWDYSFSQ